MKYFFHSQKAVIKLLIAAFLLLNNSIGLSQSPESKSRTVTMTIQGEIKPDLIPKVKDAMAMTIGDPLPAGLIILINSQGGDGMAAIEVGRLLRLANAHVFVTGKCASACVFILMGGVVRQAPELAIGIHRARLTTISKQTGKRIEVNAEDNPKTAAILAEGNRKLRQYVKDMGMSDEFYSRMESTPVDKLRWLSRTEARELGIIGIEENYLQQREAYVMERYKTKPGELKRNTDQIIDRCSEEFTKPNGNFTRCYRLGLDRPTTY